MQHLISSSEELKSERCGLALLNNISSSINHQLTTKLKTMARFAKNYGLTRGTISKLARAAWQWQNLHEFSILIQFLPGLLGYNLKWTPVQATPAILLSARSVLAMRVAVAMG